MRLDAAAPIDVLVDHHTADQHAADQHARRTRLAAVADRVRPVMLAREQTLPLVAPLTTFFPDGVLRRGITITVEGDGATSLAFALAAAPVRAGSWVALVDLPEGNLAAAVDAGVALDRLACIDSGEQWAPAVAATLGAFDLVVVGITRRVRAAEVRRLTARARERGAVIVVLGAAARGAVAWPEAPDLRLTATASRWHGLGAGHGHLRSRTIEVLAEGRRSFSRPRRGEIVMPLAPAHGPAGSPLAPAVSSAPAAGPPTAPATVIGTSPPWVGVHDPARRGVARAG